MNVPVKVGWGHVDDNLSGNEKLSIVPTALGDFSVHDVISRYF
jgi:hypothetical protein